MRLIIPYFQSNTKSEVEIDLSNFKSFRLTPNNSYNTDNIPLEFRGNHHYKNEDGEFVQRIGNPNLFTISMYESEMQQLMSQLECVKEHIYLHNGTLLCKFFVSIGI